MLDTHCLLHEVDELHKEWAICHHSKKLAIAFGLISTAAGTPLHIFKNLLVYEITATLQTSSFQRWLGEKLQQGMGCAHVVTTGDGKIHDLWRVESHQ